LPYVSFSKCTDSCIIIEADQILSTHEERREKREENEVTGQETISSQSSTMRILSNKTFSDNN